MSILRFFCWVSALKPTLLAGLYVHALEREAYKFKRNIGIA